MLMDRKDYCTSFHVSVAAVLVLGSAVCRLASPSSQAEDILNETSEEYPHLEDGDAEALFSFLTMKYNKTTRPNKNSAENVTISLYAYSISSVDELNTEYTLQTLYRQTWSDPRLKFPDGNSVRRIVGDNSHADKVWVPNVHVVKNKDIGLLSTSASGKALLHIDPDGTVTLRKRVNLRPRCEMEFYKYPLDKQKCELSLESSTLTVDHLLLSWAPTKAMTVNDNFYLTGYEVTNLSYYEAQEKYPKTGNFSRLVVKFVLEREFGHFLLDIYVPAILFVFTSWTSFWVEIPAAPARVTLTITTMLTLVTSEKAMREKLPKVPYINAIDVWNVVCIAFIFASLVEYAMVNYIYHKDKRRKRGGMKRVESTATFGSVDTDTGSVFSIFSKKYGQHSEPRNQMSTSRSMASLADIQSLSSHGGDISCPWPLDDFKLTPQDIANGIDRKCRIIFPVGFAAFNIVYWLVLWL